MQIVVMWDYISIDQFYILLGISIILFLFIAEYKGPHGFNKKKIGSCYGYGKYDGPHLWAEKFPSAVGQSQSPINLISNEAMVMQVETLENPLEFSMEYTELPSEITLFNDGHTINLYPQWACSPTPTISGGPLNDEYEFYSVSFRWSSNDEEGTEHMIDNVRYAMEVQTSWMRGGIRNLYKAVTDGDVIIVAYIYQITPVDNPYLEPILNQLGPTCEPFQKYFIEPIPLSLTAPSFSCGYFSYMGSLTFPPCTEGIRWIVQPEPLSISRKQIKKLRKTPMPYCGSSANVRPVQFLNNREIIFYE